MNTPTRPEIRPAEKRSRAALKIYQDNVKADHTSHWDWDYLSRDEIAQLAATRPYQEPVRAKDIVDPRPSSRPLLLGALGAAAAATVSGLLLFAG